MGGGERGVCHGNRKEEEARGKKDCKLLGSRRNGKVSGKREEEIDAGRTIGRWPRKSRKGGLGPEDFQGGG